MKRSTQIPGPEDFLETFGVEPLRASPEDGFWAYRFRGELDSVVIFSVDVFERSVQTRLEVGGVLRANIVHERAVRVAVYSKGEQKGLDVEFEAGLGECRTRLRLKVAPDLEVAWTSLET